MEPTQNTSQDEADSVTQDQDQGDNGQALCDMDQDNRA